MKFYYFFSDIYKKFDEYIQFILKNSSFEICPLEIPDLKAKNGHTFNGGVSVKLDLLLDCIQNNMGSHIVFSDATIYFNRLLNPSDIYSYFDSFKSNDITVSYSYGYNNYCIALIMVRCCPETYEFFKNIRDEVVSTCGWDQLIMAQCLHHEKSLSIAKFDKRIICDYKFDALQQRSFVIYKSWIHHTDDAINNYNQRIQNLQNYGFFL